MPLYEFQCALCSKRFTKLIGMVASEGVIECPKCGSQEARKLVSRFMKGKTEDDRVDEIADRLEHFGEPDSSREARSMMREMGKAMDEDLADEMEEMFESDMEGNDDE